MHVLRCVCLGCGADFASDLPRDGDDGADALDSLLQWRSDHREATDHESFEWYVTGPSVSEDGLTYLRDCDGCPGECEGHRFG